MAIDDAVSILADDVFETPELTAPPFEPDAHRAVITAVTSGYSATKGTPYVQINWQSRDNAALEGNVKVWIPKLYEESGFAPDFDPKTMESGQQTSFRMGIASSDKRATLQELVFNTNSVARKAGRNPVELGLKRATSLEGYAENINAMLIGVECIVLRRARGGDDPAFANNPEAKRFVAADSPETSPKLFAKYRCAWESE